MGTIFRFGLTVVCLTFSSLLVLGQTIAPSAVAWQKCYGGSFAEFLVDVRAVSSNGFVVVGSSSSPASGNKTSGNYGQDDAWVVRLDAAGNILWDRNYGGSAMDALYTIETTHDGGFIAGGRSQSGVSGNKTSRHYGAAADYNWWVLRLDAQGNILWDRTFPGKNSSDEVRSIAEMADRGFCIAGRGESDPTNSGCAGFGNLDWWLKKLDAFGNIVWERCYGGTSMEVISQILPLKDGFLLGGSSYSDPSGNKTSPHYGQDDVWLVKVNLEGEIVWQKSYGGTGVDNLARLQPTPDGGFILICNSTSVPSGNKTSEHYGGDFGYDLWVVRVDGEGNILWDHTYGGMGNELFGGIQITVDGGYILAASSDSGVGGNKTTSNWGGLDYWVVRLDPSGNKVWEQTFGGTGNDRCFTTLASIDGGFLLAGYSDSGTNGNKTASKADPFSGGTDFWLLKLQPDVAYLKPALPVPNNALGNDGLGLSFTAPPGLYAFEYSVDVINWTSFQTNQIVSGPLLITAPTSQSAPQGFFRTRTLP